MADTKEQPAKRKPGRPRKNPLKEPPKRSGILTEPTNKDNMIELMYDKPQNFKKLSQFWKSITADKIVLSFRPDRVMMFAKSYKEKNVVRTRILGSKVSSYYCPTVMHVVVLFANLDIILQKLDKAYETIAFVITTKHRDKMMHCILQNEFDIPEYYDIDILQDIPFVNQFENVFDESIPYPLQFKLPGKYFKRTISDVKLFDEQWTITMMGNLGNLMFTFRSVNGQVRARNVPKDVKKVIEVNELKADELFNVSVFAADLKPTSAAQLSEIIHFKAAKDRQLWIWKDLDDGAIFVDVLVDIINYKKTGPVPDVKL